MTDLPEARLAVVENEIRGIHDDVTDVKTEITAIRNQLIGRPTWLVTLALTCSFSSSAALAMYALTHKPA